MKKLLTIFHGFCMALADSVPGVSGGTIAFLLGFYDQFVGSLDDLISGNKQSRIAALKFLIKLGIGWVIGFLLAVVILANVFESHIYLVSSLFIGFILFAIPIVILEEKACLKAHLNRSFMILIGIAIVSFITYFNPVSGGDGMDLSNPHIWTYLYVFVCGAIAICAMILPGISGSTLLLIFGIYLPVITGIKDLLNMDFHALPVLIAFGLGVITGVISIIKIVRSALQKHRAAMVYFILGLMLGSLYAIVMGPTTLDTPQEPLSLSTFSILFFLIGAAVIVIMQASKLLSQKRAAAESNS
jgi:putative membrane protein